MNLVLAPLSALAGLLLEWRQGSLLWDVLMSVRVLIHAYLDSNVLVGALDDPH